MKIQVLLLNISYQKQFFRNSFTPLGFLTTMLIHF